MNVKTILIVLFAVITAGFILNFNTKGKEPNMAQANVERKILVAYFSRTGEQYGVGNIAEGNTAIIAKMIASKTNGDLFEIKVKNDNYPKTYSALTEYAKKEKMDSLRPELADKVENFDTYDTIFIGYPNWWGDMPMPVYTFLESYDFSGKNIAPFCTHEGSGLSGTQDRAKKAAKGSEALKGFEIYGHTAQNDRKEAEKKVSNWLNEIGY